LGWITVPEVTAGHLLTLLRRRRSLRERDLAAAEQRLRDGAQLFTPRRRVLDDAAARRLQSVEEAIRELERCAG
jgi:hypothetical protein